MNQKLSTCLAALGFATFCVAPAHAQQTPEVKEKPPMYSYVSNFNLPRAHWADMDKETAEDNKLLDRAVASGTIMAYGDDHNLIHEPEGFTHDTWWSAMSMAGILNVLDQMLKTSASTSSPLLSATKHADTIWVGRFYNYKPGTWRNVYT